MKNIKVPSYTNDVNELIDATPDSAGTQAERIAKYAVDIYTQSGEEIDLIVDGEHTGLAIVHGNKPATFTVISGNGTKYARIQVSETTTVTPAGGTSIRIGATGEFVTTPLTLAANTIQDIYFKDAGSFTIPKRKLVTFLYLYTIGSSVITGDITGMKLTYLWLDNLGSSVINGDITGMKLTYILLNNLGSSVITGDITGMELTSLYLSNLGSSVITGDITGMELTYLRLNNLGSSLSYGTNPLNIRHSNGIQLLGDTMFTTAAEYARLIQDAANGTWGGAYPFTITAGTTATDPGWDNVKTHVATLLTKAAWTIIPAAWLTTNGGSWPADWRAIGLAMAQYEDDINYPTDVNVAAAIGDAGLVNLFEHLFEDDLKTKNLTFSGYTGDVNAIIDEDSPSIAEGSTDIQKLAYYIDSLYAGDVKLTLNTTLVGLIRYNRACGELPATFTIAAGYVNTGAKYINFSEPVTVTMTGGVTLSIGGTEYHNGDTIPVASSYHVLTINNPGDDAGTITFGKRKQITYLYLQSLGSSVITVDITGMKLITVVLSYLGSSVITGDITGMELTSMWLSSIGSSVITGDITGMKLRAIYLNEMRSFLSYGTNPLNIISPTGIQLLGNTVFSASEYIQLFADAATCMSAGKWTATTKIFTISAGYNPGWSNVQAYYDIIVGGGVTVKVPLAWESGNDPFPPETLNP